jgi:osmotically-inducible protein OsmY
MATREIERRVKEAIDRQTGIRAQSIRPSVESGVVTLHGSVRTFADRQSAQRPAEATTGVTEVRNRILVLPTCN